MNKFFGYTQKIEDERNSSKFFQRWELNDIEYIERINVGYDEEMTIVHFNHKISFKSDDRLWISRAQHNELISQFNEGK